MKAVLLCAGFGTRLGELTANCPKPMLKVNGKPIVEWQILLLKKYGVSDFFINLHYLSEQIVDYLGDGKKFGVRIQYAYEDRPSGTAGGVNLFKKELGDEDFFVFYGDIVLDVPLNEMIEFHKDSSALISFYTHQRQNSNSLFAIDSETGRVIDFLERPDAETRLYFEEKYAIKDYWVNSAIYLASPKVFELMPEKEEVDIPKDLFPLILEREKLFALPMLGQRFAIDSPQRLELANEQFRGVE